MFCFFQSSLSEQTQLIRLIMMIPSVLFWCCLFCFISLTFCFHAGSKLKTHIKKKKRKKIIDPTPQPSTHPPLHFLSEALIKKWFHLNKQKNSLPQQRPWRSSSHGTTRRSFQLTKKKMHKYPSLVTFLNRNIFCKRNCLMLWLLISALLWVSKVNNKTSVSV